jgi:hypothetical protein
MGPSPIIIDKKIPKGAIEKSEDISSGNQIRYSSQECYVCNVF